MGPFTIIRTTFYKDKINVNVNELSNCSIPIDFWCLSNNYTCFEITLHTLTSSNILKQISHSYKNENFSEAISENAVEQEDPQLDQFLIFILWPAGEAA